MNYLRLIPYVIALVLIAGVSRFAYVSGYNASDNKWNEKYTADLKASNDQLAKAKAQLLEQTNKQAAAEAELLRKQKEAEKNAQNTIDDLRAGNVRLRDSLAAKRCPSVPNSGASTGGGDATSTGGLSNEDVEFLIREASRADQVTEQLIAAQQVIVNDRIVCNNK